MSRKRKWIAVDSPHEPVTRVARRALKNRLLAVWDYLPSAAERPEKDPEFVHQLRVSSRRAMAAIEMFDSLLPMRRSEWFKKQLRKVRRAAGEARDLDVLSQRLAELLRGEPCDVARPIMDAAAESRRNAQPAICKMHHRLCDRQYKRRIGKLLKRVRVRHAALAVEPDFAEVGRDSMRRAVNDFFSASRANLSDTANLHLMRIASKQVRYAMEIFAGAFPASMTEQLYPQIVELQEKLGEINDHVSALARFQEWQSHLEASEGVSLLGRLMQSEARLRDERIAAFQQYWNGDRGQRLRYQFSREFGDPQLAIRPESLPVAESG
ncbi:MAG TPA: CHAD domain-containing protein [Pirellulales bacterium]|nr:CHAD domain-containing protein [Pirellulales bacterium]